MALEKTLKVVEAERPRTIDRASARRQRLLRALDEQISKARVHGESGRTPKRPWWWVDQSGAYLVEIRYGRKPLELAKGKTAIRCETIAELCDALISVRASALKGEFDQKLEQAGTEFRARFARRK